MTHWQYTIRGGDLLDMAKVYARSRGIHLGICGDIGYLGQLHIYLDTEYSRTPNEKYFRINLNGSLLKRKLYVMTIINKFYKQHKELLNA